MILAAGLGTRMRPLSALRPKPALPVRGVPVIARLFELLVAHAVDEVIVNLHHLGPQMRETAERWTPPGLTVQFSEETEPLGTGGGIRRAADFLRESDPSIVLAGDMLFDADLSDLVDQHRRRADLATLVLRRDPRSEHFGSLGIDAEGSVRRIGTSLDLRGECAHGLFTGVRLFASRAFDSPVRLPLRDDAFEDLRDWLLPHIESGARDVRAEILDSADGAPGTRGRRPSVWEPLGTPAEYLAANLAPPHLPYARDPHPLAEGTRVEGDVVIGAKARIAAGARLERAVVWDGESVPGNLRASDGVFAGGRFHSCKPAEASA